MTGRQGKTCILLYGSLLNKSLSLQTCEDEDEAYETDAFAGICYLSSMVKGIPLDVFKRITSFNLMASKQLASYTILKFFGQLIKLFLVDGLSVTYHLH